MRPFSIFIYLTAVFILSAGNLRAEQALQVTQTTVTVPKKTVVDQNMRLSEAEAAPFWKVYEDYEIALDQVHQKMEELIHSYAQHYRTLSDEEAEKMLQSYFAIEKEKLALREQYIPKFKEVLSGRQVARLYQIENKFDAVVRFGLVDQIPLVNTTENETANF